MDILAHNILSHDSQGLILNLFLVMRFPRSEFFQVSVLAPNDQSYFKCELNDLWEVCCYNPLQIKGRL